MDNFIVRLVKLFFSSEPYVAKFEKGDKVFKLEDGYRVVRGRVLQSLPDRKGYIIKWESGWGSDRFEKEYTLTKEE